jgi:hypothetical protein
MNVFDLRPPPITIAGDRPSRIVKLPVNNMRTDTKQPLFSSFSTGDIEDVFAFPSEGGDCSSSHSGTGLPSISLGLYLAINHTIPSTYNKGNYRQFSQLSVKDWKSPNY